MFTGAGTEVVAGEPDAYVSHVAPPSVDTWKSTDPCAFARLWVTSTLPKPAAAST